MKIKHFITQIACTFIGYVMMVGCSPTTTNTPSATTPSATVAAQTQPVKLTVSAAASMQDAMKVLEPIYEKEHPNTNITFNFGSSGSLQQQIEQGAPADVFISAAPKQMDALDLKSLLLAGTRKDLLKNQVVLIAPKNAKANISNFQDLTSSKVRRFSIGDPKSVPAGQYSEQVLTSLKIYDQLKPKTVFAKDVRQVLSYVETGNADAGIVYATDAKVADNVKVVAIAPESTHKPIIYPIAVIKRTQNQQAAKEFVQFLSSNSADAVFQKYGFSTVNK